MGTSALVAFMGLVTSKRFTATQFALLTSLAALPRTVLSSPSGWLAEYLGWTAFFIVCGLVAIPGLFLILKIKDLQELN
jgi:PAT family beta-lactamase induction signal transducer AmpG